MAHKRHRLTETETNPKLSLDVSPFDWLPIELLIVITKFYESGNFNDRLPFQLTCHRFSQIGQMVFDPSVSYNLPLRYASKKGHTNEVARLLQDTRVDPRSEILATRDTAFQLACKTGHSGVVQIFLNDGRVDPTEEQNHALRMACTYGHASVVDLLLKDGRVAPETRHSWTVPHLMKAIKHQQADVIRVLVKDGRVPLTQIIYKHYGFATKNVDVIKALLNDPKSRIKPGKNDLITACQMGWSLIVEFLLKDGRLDPSRENNKAIFIACTFGNADIATLLLSDARVNPTAQEFQVAFINACVKGYTDIVSLLLSDARINPAAQDNIAFISACTNGQIAIVNILLKDPRVDLAAQKKNGAFYIARSAGVFSL